MIPEGPLGFVFRHFWLLLIATTLLNGFIWWHRARPHIRKDPSLELGYRRMIRGWMIFGSIPWIVMGVGILFGGLRGVFDYFNPRNGPYVIAWYVSVVVLWILAAVWLFLRGGAEDLVRHPGLLNFDTGNPWTIKALFLLSLAGGIAGLCFILFSDLQLP